MANTSETPVLIAGAGPSGLILALSIAQYGIPVRIIQKDTAFHIGQRGSGIQPRTLELFHFLGTLPDVQKKGFINPKIHAYKLPGGTEVAKVIDMTPFMEDTPDVPFRNPLILGQPAYEAIIRDHLAKLGVHVELATELVSFEQDDQGVTAKLLKHADGKEVEETVRTEYLVGAEGARSVTRKQLGLTFLGETRGDRLILVDITVKNLGNHCWHSWGDMTGAGLFMRPTEIPDYYSCILGGKNVPFDELLSNQDALKEFMYKTMDRRDLELGEIKWQTEFRPNIRMVNKFGEGRVFVVGDAAHVHSPTGGQGMNTGVQDSFNLGWKIAYALKYGAPHSLLETYTTERLPVVKDMLERTTVYLEKTINFRASGPDTTALERPRVLHQIGVNYRWSDIVVDEQPGETTGEEKAAYRPEDPTVLRAGDRAPSAPNLVLVGGGGGDLQETRLFDIFKPTRHTVLLFGAGTEVLEALKSTPPGSFYIVAILPQGTTPQAVPGADLTVVDSQGYAFKDYPPAAQGFSVIIVRPDAVVGAVVKSAEGVKKYVQGVFGA